ncbi:MAG: hypothetical protein AAB770_00635 [Patescibacteria group bacterium]
MSQKQGHKTINHGVPKSGGVPILDSLDDGSGAEMVSIGGAPVSVPHTCGCDGTEHRFGQPCVSPYGGLVLLPE